MVKRNLHQFAFNDTRKRFFRRADILRCGIDKGIARFGVDVEFNREERLEIRPTRLTAVTTSDVLKRVLVVKDSGIRLAVVREIAFDAAVDEHHVLEGEHDLVVGQADFDCFVHLGQRGDFL